MSLLVLVLVILTQSSWVTMEVVHHFESCSKFFIKIKDTVGMEKTIRPTVLPGNEYKTICQSYKGSYQYATLFDTENRIPVYSAYVFSSVLEKDQQRPKAEWKNEPGLDNLIGKDMVFYGKDQREKLMNQAVDEDYSGSGYTRGHVYPNQYANNENQALSTFTFTNVAPQTKAENEKWASEVETPMRQEILKMCKYNNKYEVYIVTGVIPGNKWIKITRKKNDTPKEIPKGINIPKYYWTTYCCKVDDVMKSNAFMAQHKEQGIYVSKLNVKGLNQKLTELYLLNNKKDEFEVFGNLCLD